ncbi:MAG: DUF262 domain-containing HNH endonuclease family protein [Bacteroidia bacterium]|nr:DUF262 domain-containing HNH endonuclease family protein [Bacteroidia bacterium]
MELGKSFSISAKTCTLKYNNQEGKAAIINNEVKYVIPIYQRPYSWSDEQIRKFISDIFISFCGNDGNVIEEPMFIGTMQLSAKNSNAEQEIIDGQQRLTTLLIFLKVLKVKFPNCDELHQINLDWLSTRVNNGRQQLCLQELILSDLSSHSNNLNTYLNNAFLVFELLNEQTKDSNEEEFLFDINRFVRYLISKVYFVVIETRAGLSKTLQIFNSINTTGMDLNGGDIFKIKMYEYLKVIKGRDETAFDDISKLYESIDKYNAELKYEVTDMRGILRIYQSILIAKFDLNNILYSYSNDTFFERLFDTIFKINSWEHFNNNAANVDLSLDDIQRIIEVQYLWEKDWYRTAEDMGCYKLIEQSRYSKYADLMPIILMFQNLEYDRFEFLRLLSRVYIIYSIRFQKSIYEINNWSNELIKYIINGATYDSIIFKIKEKISDRNSHNQGFNNLDWFVSENLTENAKRKNMICSLSALLEEDYRTTDKDQIEMLKKSLFESLIDIEHLQSYRDSDGEKRLDIWKEWGENINSIGNLMILEQEINRSISNNPYEVKVDGYNKSKFSIVKNQVTKYSDWDLEKCLNRKNAEREKVLDYIFRSSQD